METVGTAGMASSDDKKEFGELAQPRFAEDEALDAYVELYKSVLTAYGYRCALTGERFRPSPALTHPDLDVVAIRRREAGGPLAIDNYLPMIAIAARAFRAGQIIIGSDYTVLADFKVIAAPLAGRLRPDARLVLPDDRRFWPNAAHLAYHRRSVLGA